MPWKCAIAVFALSVVAYLPTLKNGFVFDDHGLIEQNTYLQDLANIPTFFSTDLWSFYYPEYQVRRIHYWRPLALTCWALIHRFFGFNPAAYHLVSILLHGLSTVLVFLLGRQLAGSQKLAVAAAAIFALHPVHIDAVAWASGLSDILVALVSLLALLAYHYYRTSRNTWWGIAVLVFTAATLLSKESGIIIPLLLGAYEIFLTPGDSAKRPWFLLISSCIVAVIYLGVRTAIMGPLETGLLTLAPRDLFFTIIAALGNYARLLLYPVHLVATYPNRSFSGIADSEILKGLFFLLILGIFLLITCRTRKENFWLSFMIITLLPALNVIAVGTDLLGERYLYLPSVAFCFLMAEFFFGYVQKQKAAVFLLVVLVASYTIRSFYRFPDWRDEYTYLTTTLRDAPNAYLYHNNLGRFLHTERKDLEGARKAFEVAAALVPNYEYAQSNLAIICLEQGELQKALEYAVRACQIQPTWVDPLITAAEASGRLGRLKESEQFLRKALILQPNHPDALNNMGNIAFLKGNVREAVQWWRKTELVDSSNLNVLFNLGIGYEQLGKTTQAASYFTRFSEKAPPEMSQLKEQARVRANYLSAPKSDSTVSSRTVPAH